MRTSYLPVKDSALLSRASQLHDTLNPGPGQYGASPERAAGFADLVAAFAEGMAGVGAGGEKGLGSLLILEARNPARESRRIATGNSDHSRQKFDASLENSAISVTDRSIDTPVSKRRTLALAA